MSRSAAASHEKRAAATIVPRRAEFQGLTRMLGQGPSGLPEDIASRQTAGVALVDCRAERGELRLKFLLLAFEVAKGCADDFTGILVAPALDLGQHKAVKLLG